MSMAYIPSTLRYMFVLIAYTYLECIHVLLRLLMKSLSLCKHHSIMPTVYYIIDLLIKNTRKKEEGLGTSRSFQWSRINEVRIIEVSLYIIT